jgi:hypothetical protein
VAGLLAGRKGGTELVLGVCCLVLGNEVTEEPNHMGVERQPFRIEGAHRPARVPPAVAFLLTAAWAAAVYDHVRPAVLEG